MFVLDERKTGCYEPFADSNGNITRPINVFAGLLEELKCIAHCGCRGNTHASWDFATMHCFCGDTAGTECITDHEQCTDVSTG